MISKLLISKKNIVANCCNRIIIKGETYNKTLFSQKKIDKRYKVIGTLRIMNNICIDCYNYSIFIENECKQGNHKYTPTECGHLLCYNCGIDFDFTK
jgi:hypothetical protein